MDFSAIQRLFSVIWDFFLQFASSRGRTECTNSFEDYRLTRKKMIRKNTPLFYDRVSVFQVIVVPKTAKCCAWRVHKRAHHRTCQRYHKQHSKVYTGKDDWFRNRLKHANIRLGKKSKSHCFPDRQVFPFVVVTDVDGENIVVPLYEVLRVLGPFFVGYCVGSTVGRMKPFALWVCRV